MLNIFFPGSPTLNSTQVIRRDGKINLPLIGDVDAAGMTPKALEAKLLDLYAPQLSSKQVTVQVQSSSFPFYVTGMVLHPGKILTDHPITALEAVMEAGGFDYSKADLKDVTVIRRENGIMKNYKLNLKAVLDGRKLIRFISNPMILFTCRNDLTCFKFRACFQNKFGVPILGRSDFRSNFGRNRCETAAIHPELLWPRTAILRNG